MPEKPELSARAKRKIRRRAENDFYAKDARFWVNPKTADRMGYSRPVNSQAAKVLSKKTPKKKKR